MAPIEQAFPRRQRHRLFSESSLHRGQRLLAPVVTRKGDGGSRRSNERVVQRDFPSDGSLQPAAVKAGDIRVGVEAHRVGLMGFPKGACFRETDSRSALAPGARVAHL